MIHDYFLFATLRLPVISHTLTILIDNLLIGIAFIHFQEPSNLTNVSSLRYSGLVHKKTVGILPADKKGFTLVLKTKKNQVRTEMCFSNA